MARMIGRGGLQYSALLPGDPDLGILNDVAVKIKGYYVTYLDVAKAIRSIYGSYRNFTQSYKACKLLGGKGPRCFIYGATGWLAVNPVKMPH